MISKIALVGSQIKCSKNNRTNRTTNVVKRGIKIYTKEDEELIKKHNLHDMMQIPDQIVNLGREDLDQFSEEFATKIKKGEDVPTPEGLDGRLALLKSSLIQRSSPEAVARFEAVYGNMTENQRAGMTEYLALQKKLNADLVKKYGREAFDIIGTRTEDILSRVYPPEREPVTVSISGAAGQIAYSLLFRIASGGMFGNKTPVNIRLLDIPGMETKLEGVKMEIDDCAFPLVRSVSTHVDPSAGFEGADWVLLVGGSPRTKGMERKDLLLKNAEVFKSQGLALDSSANGALTRVLVVGNPANTNAWIASNYAPSIPKENFAALTKLDQNRGLSLLAQKLNVGINDIEKFIIWGNHSATQFPDVSQAVVNGKLVSSQVDKKWLTDTFIPQVQQRGAAVIAARGASSAASAANAICDNVREWYQGTKSRWTSVAVPSKGEYGVTPGLFYSYPVVYENMEYAVVEQLPIDDFAAERMEATHKELLQELEVVQSLKN